MVKFWMLNLRIGRKAIGRTIHNASPRPKFLATKYQKSHVRFKDLQLFGGPAAFHHSYGPKSCSLYLQPFWDQKRQTSSTRLWKPYQQRLETRSRRENLRMSKCVTCNAIITSPLSTSLLLLICSRKSFLGCTVVSAPNGPQSQVPPDHMGEAWAKGASGSVSNRHAAFNETVLKHTHTHTHTHAQKHTHLSRRQVIKNRTATGYHNWNPSKLEDVPSCITLSPAVSLHFEDGTCFSENFTSHPYC